MQIFIAILLLIIIITFFQKFFTSTVNNFKILIGIRRGFSRLEYVDDYATIALWFEGLTILTVALLSFLGFDIKLPYANLIKTLILIFLSAFSFIFISAINWAVGVLVTNRFSLIQKKELFADLLLSGFAGHFARVKVGNIFFVHLFTVLFILYIAFYAVYKIFIIILAPIITWLMAP